MLTNSEKIYMSRQIKCRVNEICKALGVDKIAVTMDHTHNEFESLLKEVQFQANKISDETFFFTRVKEYPSRTFIFHSTLESSNKVPSVTVTSKFFLSKFPKNVWLLFFQELVG